MYFSQFLFRVFASYIDFSLVKQRFCGILSVTGFHTRSNPVFFCGLYGVFRILNIKMEFFMDKQALKRLSFSALVAAMYAGATLLFAPLSFGALQCRFSEALCILPFVYPESAWGLFIGCLLANLMSGNLFDVIFGSLATLLSSLCIAAIGKRGHSKRKQLFACCMPVLINALIVGAIITGEYEGKHIFQNLGLYALNAAYIALSEALVMFLLALPLLDFLIKKSIFK